MVITFILNFIKNKLLDFLKSKYFYIFLAAVIIIGIIIFVSFQLKSKDKKIKELEEKLYTTKLELSSSDSIEKLSSDKEYDANEVNTLDKIIKDYNKARSPPR